MQIESLKVFCDVARHRSFSQAASANGLSQSAASQIVLQLEKRLGVQLVNRSTRPLQLTELGQVYYEGCKRLVEQYLDLEANIRQAQMEIDATVEVAAIYSVGLGDMGQYVERFTAQRPNARVHIEYLHPDRVYERVLQGTADMGLVSFPRKARELVTLPWRDEEMVLVCPPGHALARQKSVRPGQLEGERYVGFEKGLVIRREVDRFLREQGVSVNVALEFDNIENIKKAVEESQGVALLPEPTLQHEVEAGSLVPLPLAGVRFVRPLGIIQRRQHPLTSAAQLFIELLRQGNGGPAEPASAVPGRGRTPRRGNGELRHNGQSRGPKKDRVT
jgi:DNA-binding transcriptional LysR family regulator